MLGFVRFSHRLQTNYFYLFFRYLTYVVSFSNVLLLNTVVFKEMHLYIEEHRDGLSRAILTV